ncbi:MAG: PEP-CTERM sorting domain-containing protein [Microcoleaceae cyanobacterium]
MNKLATACSVLAGFGAVIASSSLLMAQAATIGSSFTLTNFRGRDAQVSVDLIDVDGGVKFDVSIDRSQTVNGDLFGFFLSIDGDQVDLIDDIEGSDVTQVKVKPNRVINLGNKNNLRGFDGDKFDVGLTFGALGDGDLLSDTSFTLKGGLTVADFQGQVLGARLQSVGRRQNGRSKLSGEGDLAGGTKVPEPITVLGTGVALLFGGVFYRERSKKNI